MSADLCRRMGMRHCDCLCVAGAKPTKGKLSLALEEGQTRVVPIVENVSGLNRNNRWMQKLALDLQSCRILLAFFDHLQQCCRD